MAGIGEQCKRPGDETADHLSDEHALSVLEEVELERAERKETSNKSVSADSLVTLPEDGLDLREHLLTHHLEPQTEQEAAAPGIAKTRG